MINAVLISKLASLLEIQTFYSMEDIMNLYEVIIVDNYNQHILNKE